MQREKEVKEAESRKVRERKRREKEAKEIKNVETGRSEFRFQDISVHSVGSDGRSREGVGARYGVPPQDRKKGQIKIPRRVI